MDKRPQLYIIAGPNGSGKTTFAEEFLPYYAKCPIFINADTISRGLSGFSPEATALKAGRLLLEQIETYAVQGIDFSFETTLSGVTYLSRLKRIKRIGYVLHLFFLWVPDVKLSLARVANRVKIGGHGVPEKVVKRRFHRGLRNFFKLYRPILDSWMLFDNSGNVPLKVAEEGTGKIKVYDRDLYGRILQLAEGK